MSEIRVPYQPTTLGIGKKCAARIALESASVGDVIFAEGRDAAYLSNLARLIAGKKFKGVNLTNGAKMTRTA